MQAKQELVKFLADENIDYTLPAGIQEDESIYRFIHQVCEKLVRVEPILLSEGNKNNLETLMQVAKHEQFYTDDSNHIHRPESFAEAINILYQADPCALNQDTFDAICRITQSELREEDLTQVAGCFVALNKVNLLTKKNIQNLIENIAKAEQAAESPSSSSSSSSAFSSLRSSRAEELNACLTFDNWLTQDDFDFIMQSKPQPYLLFTYMRHLHDKGLNTTANCQAMIDAEIRPNSIEHGLPANTQAEFNGYISELCDQKLGQLSSKINELEQLRRAPAIHQHASQLLQKLIQLRNTPDVSRDPRDFLHTLVIVDKALPTAGRQPEKADIEGLIALGELSEGRPSTLWRTIGSIMMALGAAIAIAAGIVLSIGTVGIASPIGIAIATAGGVGAASALTGIGIFAMGARKGLSKDIMDLADSVEEAQTAPQPV